MKRSLFILILIFAGLFFANSMFRNLSATEEGESPVGVTQKNGDVNGDGVRDVSDPIYLLGYLFFGGPAPVPIRCEAGIADFQNGDTDGKDGIDISDGIYLLSWLFFDGPAPVQACDADIGGGGTKPIPADPNPIPGGIVRFGTFLHHFPPGWGNEPSQIGDFNGFVGLTRIHGTGTGTNTITGVSMPHSFQADMGFMKGEFVGIDGKKYHGAFGFI